MGKKEALILRLLAEHGEMYGLDLVKRAGGVLGRGTVYVTLMAMEEELLLLSRKDPVINQNIGIQRLLYSITPIGRRALANEANR